MKALAIVALCTLAAVVYGIAHDQVTARICVEYFTIGHPRVVESTSPTVLGAVWGVLATWWVGVGLGGLWALAARLGPRPKLEPRRFVKPALVVMLVSALAAFCVGLLGHELAVNDIVILRGDLAENVPSDRHVAFLACLWAHSASYFAGALGGLFIAITSWRARGRLSQLPQTR